MTTFVFAVRVKCVCMRRFDDLTVKYNTKSEIIIESEMRTSHRERKSCFSVLIMLVN